MSDTRCALDDYDDRVKYFGLPANDPGTCLGVAGAGLDASLTGNPRWLIDVLNFIVKVPVETFTAENLRIGLEPISDIITPADIEAVMTTAIAYQNVDAIDNIINNRQSVFSGDQDVFLSSQRYGSAKLEKLGGMVSLIHHLAVFDYARSLAFLENLKSLYQQIDITFPIALFIKSCNHAATLTYDSKSDIWYIIDGNIVDQQSYGSNVEKAAKVLVDCFSCTKVAAFNINFVTCKSYVPAIREKFDAWTDQLSKAYVMDEMQVTGHDSIGTTLLYLTAVADFTDMALQLLAKGADPLRSAVGYTALQAATDNGNITLVKAILEHSTQNIDREVPETGETPLIIAARRGHKDIVSLLLSHGADAKLKDKEHKTALQHATAIEIRQMLRTHMAIKFTVVPNNQVLQNSNRSTLFKRAASSPHKKEPPTKKMRPSSD